MSTKERIQAVIEKLEEEKLDDLYLLIHEFVESQKDQPKTGIMGKLKSVKIDAPVDFAINLDQYLNGEKRVEENLH